MSKSKKKRTKKRNPNSGIQYAVVSANYTFWGELVDCTVIKRTRSEQVATDIFVQEYNKYEKMYYGILKIENGKIDDNYRNFTVEYLYTERAKFLSKELGVPVHILHDGSFCIGGDAPESVYF